MFHWGACTAPHLSPLSVVAASKRERQTTDVYAVVQYGTDPDHLDRTTKSATRINPTHGDMTFRVRVNDLQPGTTYYYRMACQQARGASAPGTSAIKQFTTRAVNETASQ